MLRYLDASPIIYWIEKVPAFYPHVDARIKQSGVSLASSQLALMECLVHPLQQRQVGLQQDYELFFRQLAHLIPFSDAVFLKAAEIRAMHGFRTPDALHLAAAVVGGCDTFLTNDASLKSFPDLAVEIVC